MSKLMVLFGLLVLGVICGCGNNTPSTTTIIVEFPTNTPIPPTSTVTLTPTITNTFTVTNTATPTCTATSTNTPVEAEVYWYYSGSPTSGSPVTYTASLTNTNLGSTWSDTYNVTSTSQNQWSLLSINTVTPGISTYSLTINDSYCSGVSIMVLEGSRAVTVNSATGSCGVTLNGVF